MKVNILSTMPISCGIGFTNDYLKEGMKPHLQKSDIEVDQIYIKNPLSKNPFYFTKLALLTGRDCDLVHVHYNHDCFGKFKKYHGFQNLIVYPVLKKVCKKRVITTFHEQPDLTGSSRLRKLFYKFINWAPLTMSDIIITTTDRAKELLLGFGLPSSKIYVLPLGCFKKVKRPRSIITNKKMITLFGFVDNNKGHDKVVRALRRLPKNYTFLIAGAPRTDKGESYYDKVKQMIIKYGLEERVIHLGGHVDKPLIPIIMAMSDVLIFPYSDITSSLSLTTAISYKRPIITSDIFPFKEFHEAHGCTELFKLNSIADLRRKIVKIVRNNLRKGEMEKFIRNNNWEEIGRKQLMLYQLL